MNKQIRELARQAGMIVDKANGFDKTQLTASEIRFAELIVKKCIKMVENEAAQYAEPVWAFELVNDMHEHFGVAS